MTTTVKLNDQIKREIENLQAQILIKQNRKLTQQEIMEKLIEFALKFAINIFGSLEENKPVEEDYAWKMLDNPLKWGIKDSSTTLDEKLYR
jgi:hypothetical protein